MIKIIQANIALLKKYIENNYLSKDTLMKEINLECLDKISHDLETFISKNPQCEVFKKDLEERLTLNDEINSDNEDNKMDSLFAIILDFLYDLKSLMRIEGIEIND